MKKSTLSSSSGLLIQNAGVRARLRREDPFAVGYAYEWVKIAMNIASFQGRENLLPRLIALLPLVALVREESGNTFGADLRQAKVSEQRLKRFLNSSREDIEAQTERMLRLLGGKVNIPSMLEMLIFWGEAQRRKVAMDYYLTADDGDNEDAKASEATEAA